jgi:hypothetical protein
VLPYPSFDSVCGSAENWRLTTQRLAVEGLACLERSPKS